MDMFSFILAFLNGLIAIEQQGAPWTHVIPGWSQWFGDFPSYPPRDKYGNRKTPHVYRAAPGNARGCHCRVIGRVKYGRCEFLGEPLGEAGSRPRLPRLIDRQLKVNESANAWLY